MATDLSRLHVFIDGGYVFNVFDPYRKLGYRYSCKRLVRLLSMNYQLLAVHYVNSINLRDAATKEKQERFYYGQLRDTLGWDVHILPLQWQIQTSCRPCKRSSRRGRSSEMRTSPGVRPSTSNRRATGRMFVWTTSTSCTRTGIRFIWSPPQASRSHSTPQ
jgi:hypothetical protein